ncbi:MAG: LPS assembly lipoprotein LptE [Chitinophagales bacterium]|nr:LPS assembly lipoprotein LptE [Chitinophagales bacterium]MDW8428255.1 LptE family protein [Chitinophagales bacterium]
MVAGFCACGIYSFTGASVPPSAQTATVQFFPNHAPIVVPALSQQFTEALKNKIQSTTNLTLVSSNGDLEFSGAITDYRIQPQAASANEIAAVNRLLITVQVDFTNRADDNLSWSASFTRYADYSSSADLTAVQDRLITEIVDQLVEDIFNKALANW